MSLQCRRACLLLALILSTPAVSSRAAEPGASEYLAGLEQFDQGGYAAAAEAFTQAVAASDENARYRVGLGVAEMFALKREASRKQLDRAARLEPADATVKLWLYTWKMMFDPRSLPGPPPYKATDYAQPLIDAAIEYGTPRNAESQAQAALALRQASQVWAAREMSRDEFLPLMTARIEPLFAAGKFADCLALVTRLRAGNPHDVQLLGYSAHCRLQLEDYAAARSEATEALTAAPTAAPMFLCRAQAAVHMGALDSAAADFAIAQAIEPAAAKLQREAFDRLLAAARAQMPSASSASVLQELKQAIADDQPAEQQFALAEKLERAAANLRCDRAEAFTRGLARCQWAVDRDPQNVDKLVALADFCVRPSELLAVRFDPKFTTQLALGQTDFARAEGALAAALKLQPKSVPALTLMALVRESQKKDGAMIHYVDLALAAGGSNLDLARIYLEHNLKLADFYLSNAQKWRQPTISYTYEGGVRYRVETPATAAALAKAAAQEAKAKAAREQAPRPLAALRGSAKGTVDGYLGDATYFRWAKQDNEAVAALEAALKLQPWHWQANQMLVELLPRVGQIERALALQDQLANLASPSAELALEPLWLLAAQTRYTSAVKLLDAAERKDPASLQIAAYRATLLAAAERNDDARRAAQLALALAEGGARLTGNSLSPAAKRPLSAEGAGLPMLMHWALGRALVAEENSKAALEEFLAMQSIGQRVATDARRAAAPRTKLPAGALARGDGWSINALLIEAGQQAAAEQVKLAQYPAARKQLALTMQIDSPAADGPRRHRTAMELLTAIEQRGGRQLLAQHFPPETLQLLRVHGGRQTYQDLVNGQGRFAPPSGEPSPVDPAPRTEPPPQRESTPVDDPRLRGHQLRIQSLVDFSARLRKQIADFRDDPSKRFLAQSLEDQAKRNDEEIARLRAEMARLQGE